MLEKKQSDILVEKLQAILLIEANQNAMNKIIFNTRTIPKLEENEIIPREIMRGQRGLSIIQITLNKKLLVDILNQSKLPNITISTDASNCFDRVVYPIAGTTYQYFGLPLDFVISFFTIIQKITFSDLRLTM